MVGQDVTGLDKVVFHAVDGILDLVRSRELGDVCKRQASGFTTHGGVRILG